MLKNFAKDPRPSRRRFLQGSAAAAAGLTVGFRWNGGMPKFASAAYAADGTLAANAFVRIGTDNTVTVLSKHLEMGQGVYTGLATIVAEELDADWAQIRVESAPADASLYNNLQFGPVQEPAEVRPSRIPTISFGRPGPRRGLCWSRRRRRTGSSTAPGSRSRKASSPTQLPGGAPRSGIWRARPPACRCRWTSP